MSPYATERRASSPRTCRIATLLILVTSSVGWLTAMTSGPDFDLYNFDIIGRLSCNLTGSTNCACVGLVGSVAYQGRLYRKSDEALV